MPEMLWAVLLAEALPRKDYLGVFRRIINECSPWFEMTPEEREQPVEGADSEGINYTIALDQTKLSELHDDRFSTFFKIATRHPLGYAALRPLLLIDSLPGIERWRRAFAIEPADSDWRTLAMAIAATLDHQSEKSTDVRWLKVMLPTCAGRMHFPESMRERVTEFYEFPNRGDMKSVRPSIRSCEMSLRRTPPSPWIANFWDEMLEETDCFDPTTVKDYPQRAESKIVAKNLFLARDAVIARFLECMTPRRTDARLDSAFGLTLYALSLVEEIAAHSVQQRVLGQLGLRSLAESNITLKYLAHKNDDALWQSWRVFGAGQAKLAFLRAQEAEELPGFIDEAALHAIANEDVWQEFLDIDVGHWTKSNLRILATECGEKETYDAFYGWPSTFVHAHWGAVRDTNFITCHNPLHRLHRIPRRNHRTLRSVEDDAARLANEMIAVLDSLYPSGEPLLRLVLESKTSALPAPNA